MCKISVIIPVYNATPWLEACIASFDNQSFKDFELLLIDDGSNDGSGELCDKLGAENAKIRAFHKENGGAGSARNIGLEHARGKYIAFADADDTVHPDFLARLYGTAEETGAELVMCDCIKHGVQSAAPQSQPIRSGVYTREQICEELYGCLIMFDRLELPPTISNCVCLFKRSLIEENGIRYPEVRLCEDSYFGSVALYCAESFVYLKGENLYNYLYHESSVSHGGDMSRAKCRWESFLTINKCYENYFGGKGVFDMQIKYNMLYFTLNQLGYIKRQRLSFKAYRKAAAALMGEEQVVLAMRGLKPPKVSARLKVTLWLIKHRNAALYCLLHRR
ncbi:MAG: glycosyltransferase family 2 protein [Clostridia bacterium]|nr:glycosyltransferase family 2 protein [Clostridia bacterium]